MSTGIPCQYQGMHVIESAIVGCWIVFGAFWAVTALQTKRTVERQDIAVPAFALDPDHRRRLAASEGDFPIPTPSATGSSTTACRSSSPASR